MKDELISFDTAKLAKEKGFPQDRSQNVQTYETYKGEQLTTDNVMIAVNDLDYYSTIAAPTQSLLQKWLRDEHGIHIEVCRSEDEWAYNLYTINQGNRHIPRGFKTYDIYEKALEAGLVEALKLIT